MKSLVAIFLILANGCASVKHSAGRGMARAGQKAGKTGTGIIMFSGVCIFALPLVVVGVPIVLASLPIYYGGCKLAKQEAEEHPFDL